MGDIYNGAQCGRESAGGSMEGRDTGGGASSEGKRFLHNLGWVLGRVVYEYVRLHTIHSQNTPSLLFGANFYS